MTSIDIYAELNPEIASEINDIAEGYDNGGCAVPESYVGSACAHAARLNFPRLEHDANHFPNEPGREQDAFRINVESLDNQP